MITQWVAIAKGHVEGSPRPNRPYKILPSPEGRLSGLTPLGGTKLTGRYI